jgi:hypothetical protein
MIRHERQIKYGVSNKILQIIIYSGIHGFYKICKYLDRLQQPILQNPCNTNRSSPEFDHRNLLIQNQMQQVLKA